MSWPTREEIGQSMGYSSAQYNNGQGSALQQARARKRTLGEMMSDSVSRAISEGEYRANQRFDAALRAQADADKNREYTETRTETVHVKRDYADEHRGESASKSSEHGGFDF